MSMNTFSKILVPVDFSKHTDAAIDTAVGIASRYGAAITLLNIFEPMALALPEARSIGAGATSMVDLMEDVRAALEKKRAAALVKGAKDVAVQVERGNPAVVIKDVADAGRYDLIVMRTIGRTGVAHFLIGSVAERVVRTASCAVLTVHEHSRPFAKILVPTDFSTHSDKALDAAVELATRWHASITLVSVFEPIAHKYPTGSGIYASFPVDHLLKDQLEALDALQQRALRIGAERVELVQRIGHPATEIVNLARDGGFDLIAMATHGRTGMSRLLIGAVAERVVRTAPCPVLTMRPREAQPA